LKWTGGIWGEGYTFKENYVKKLIGYVCRRFKVEERAEKNLKLMLKSNGMLSKKIGAIGYGQRSRSEFTSFIQIKFGNHHTIGELIGSMAHRRPHVQSTFSFFGEVLLFWVA
jgi:hypothetical protein